MLLKKISVLQSSVDVAAETELCSYLTRPEPREKYSALDYSAISLKQSPFLSKKRSLECSVTATCAQTHTHILTHTHTHTQNTKYMGQNIDKAIKVTLLHVIRIYTLAQKYRYIL